MGAKNMVIAGDYMGKPITGIGGVVQIYVDRKKQKHRHCCGPFQRRKKQPA